MESIQEELRIKDVGKRRKNMELKINSPTSSIMKPFSPTGSPLSSPLSSPTKSGRAKKTISFLLPDNQQQAGAEKLDEETKEKLEEKAEIKETGEEDVETQSNLGEKRRVYEYPDLNVSASGYRFFHCFSLFLHVIYADNFSTQ